MFSSHKKTTSNATSSSTGGFLSRLRSSNPNSTAKKPVYTTGTHRTSVAKKPRKTAATGNGLIKNHKAKPTMGQKVHGAATVISGKMHNNHQEVRAGEKEMQGKTVSPGFFNKGTTRHNGVI